MTPAPMSHIRLPTQVGNRTRKVRPVAGRAQPVRGGTVEPMIEAHELTKCYGSTRGGRRPVVHRPAGPRHRLPRPQRGRQARNRIMTLLCRDSAHRLPALAAAGRLQVCWQDTESVEAPGKGGDRTEMPLIRGED